MDAERYNPENPENQERILTHEQEFKAMIKNAPVSFRTREEWRRAYKTSKWLRRRLDVLYSEIDKLYEQALNKTYDASELRILRDKLWKVTESEWNKLSDYEKRLK